LHNFTIKGNFVFFNNLSFNGEFMSYVPNTESDFNQMLDKIGVKSFDEIIKDIPESIRLKVPLNLPSPLSELEVANLLNSYSANNIAHKTNICFNGAGCYDHYIPAIVGFVLDMPEFKTAYTPYQAEVSQGTLQAMYEFQSMISELTGMDVANASVYDGGTAIAEACLMATAHNNRKEIFIAGSINPNYHDVAKTITQGKELIFKSFINIDGTCDIDGMRRSMSDKVSAVIVQQPNFYGNIEDVIEIEKIAHSNGALFMVSADPISLGILEAPGRYGADICIGEGQPLGIPMSFGGPFLGLFAAKKEFVRKIPGRISGVTQDTDGNRGFVLTLQTREQQIKREKATSNICTNEGLMMLAATVYMATMGKSGINDTASLCLQKAHYLAGQINSLPGYSLLNNKSYFKEFLVKTPVAPSIIIEEAEKAGILCGIDTSRFDGCIPGLLIAVTEKRTKEEMDKLISVLKKFS
jgi:glycine dehydrogenase subunit 1